MNIDVGRAVKGLEQIIGQLNDVQQKQAGEVAARTLNDQSKFIQNVYKQELLKNLHGLGRGFRFGSKIERNLEINKVYDGKVLSFTADVKDSKTATIAHIWDKGGVIRPKKKVLTEPLGLKVGASPLDYGNETYSTWLYEGVGKYPKNPNIDQDVRGMLVVRERKLAGAQKVKTKHGMRFRPKVVARFLTLRSQTHHKTNWIGFSSKSAVTIIVPKLREELIKSIKELKFT